MQIRLDWIGLYILVPILIAIFDPQGIHGYSVFIIPLYLILVTSVYVMLWVTRDRTRKPLLGLAEIEAEFRRVADQIGAAHSLLPTYGNTIDGGCPHIEVKRGQYHYILVERGREYSHQRTEDLEELKYWVFRSVTHSMAFKYELANRVQDRDCRRIAFPKQIDLMHSIGSELGRRAEKDIQDILARNPYDDEPIRHLNRVSRQKTKGQSGSDK